MRTITMIRTNYSGGYIVEFEELCFDSWLLIPAEVFWAKWLRGLLYTIAILYLFLGIAIAADVFMLSIEMITSKKRIIFTYDYEKKERIQREIFVWNETIANLTLMALGSSAPEILIAVFETLSTLDVVETKDALGIFTIIGSASYNLLVISAVCIISVPSNTIKYVSEFGVFIVTSIWSLFAYFWLIIVLRWSSPNEIEIWEAVMTFLFFPLLVITAWCQDKGWWVYKCIKSKIKEQINHGDTFITNHPSSNNMPSHIVDTEHNHPGLHTRKDVKIITVSSPSRNPSVRSDVGKQVNTTMSRAFARARFRHAVVISMTGNMSTENRSKNIPSKPTSQRTDLEMMSSLELTDIRDIKSGAFSFASSTYSFLKQSKLVEVDVLFNKSCLKTNKVGFSHVVEVAKKKSMIMNESPNGLQGVFHNTVDDDQISLPIVSSDTNDYKKHYTNPNTPIKSLSKESITIRGLSRRNTVNGLNSKIEVLSAMKENNCRNDNKINNLQNMYWVHYETREGNAKDGKDYQSSSGLLIFCEEEYTKKITIPLYNMSSTDDSNEMKDFYVVLKDPCQDTTIGGPSITHVYLLNNSVPSEFVFEATTYHIQTTTENIATASAKVLRLHGNEGKASVYYRTMNGTAIGGSEMEMRDNKCDFVHIEEGVLEFQSSQTSHQIIIKVNPTAESGKTFILALYHVTGCAKIGRKNAAIISLTTEVDEVVEQITSISNNDGVHENSHSIIKQWKAQFEDAVSMETSPSCSAIILHFLCFFWKVILAFIPPRTMLGGWLTFVISLLTLGIMSALVEQFAKLLGCVIGLHVSVTGITLVALGTSMPDTFASKTAAEQDDTADAAIGNITGSNSVNVFLGLGLPWLIKSLYLHNKGEKLKLADGNLTYSLVIFLSVGFITILLLVVRRKLFKGELGGPAVPKYVCGAILVFFWIVFIALSSLQAYKVIQI